MTFRRSLFLLDFFRWFLPTLKIHQKLRSVTLFTILTCCSRKKGFRRLFTFTIKALTYTYVPVCLLILRILHQSFEIERRKGHWSEVVVHMYLDVVQLLCTILTIPTLIYLVDCVQYLGAKMTLAATWLDCSHPLNQTEIAKHIKYHLYWWQGSHRNSKTQTQMIFHDQQCNFHDYLMHGLQPTLLVASSPRWA